jgi:hypothetical protein
LETNRDPSIQSVLGSRPHGFAHETTGAARTRHSLRPLSFEGEEFLQDLGAMRGEIAKAYQVVIARDLSAGAQRAKAEGG